MPNFHFIRFNGLFKKRIHIFITVSAVFFSILACTPKQHANSQKNDAGPQASKKAMDPAKLAYINDYTQFIAGKGATKDSSLYALSQTAIYKKHQRLLQTSWSKYERNELRNIIQWRQKHIPQPATETLFYPFSGPDILNALSFFPESRRIIMIGLEKIGDIPDIRKYSQKELARGLHSIRYSLRLIMKKNFFATKQMAREFNAKMSNITGLMLFFLGKQDYRIQHLRQVEINTQGKLVPKDQTNQKKHVPGVEITFQKQGESFSRIVRFFRVDVSDDNLQKNPHFLTWLKQFDNFTSFMKSASYVMAGIDFNTDKIRNFTLAHSKYIVQGDSGIPLRFFDKKKWDLKFYGLYRILKMFKRFYQKDLYYHTRRYNQGKLPFSYGYGFRPSRSNIMIAVRKQEKTKSNKKQNKDN